MFYAVDAQRPEARNNMSHISESYIHTKVEISVSKFPYLLLNIYTFTATLICLHGSEMGAILSRSSILNTSTQHKLLLQEIIALKFIFSQICLYHLCRFLLQTFASQPVLGVMLLSKSSLTVLCPLSGYRVPLLGLICALFQAIKCPCSGIFVP